MLDKGGVVIRAFLPQLQTIFIKSLQDPTKVIRNYAAEALGKIVKLGARVDGLISELHNSLKTIAKNSIDTEPDEQVEGITTSLLKALESVISATGDKIKKPTLKSVIDTLTSMYAVKSEVIQEAAAFKIGICAKYLDESDFKALIQYVSSCIGCINNFRKLLSDDEDPVVLCGNLISLAGVIHFCADKIKDFIPSIIKMAVAVVHESDLMPVRVYAIKVLGKLLDTGASSELINELISLLENPTAQIRFETALVIKRAAKKSLDTRDLMPLVTPVLALLKDKNNSVKDIAGRAIMHLLDMRTGDYLLKDYLYSLDEKDMAKAKESCEKLLQVYKEESDNEEELF